MELKQTRHNKMSLTLSSSQTHRLIRKPANNSTDRQARGRQMTCLTKSSEGALLIMSDVMIDRDLRTKDPAYLVPHSTVVVP